MKYLHIALIAISFIFSATSIHAQVLGGTDTTFADTTYDEWDMDSTYDDYDEFDEEPLEQETVKGILRQSAQNVGAAGKQTLNQLGDKASYEAGQFLNRQADKLVNGIKQKLAEKKRRKNEQKTAKDSLGLKKVNKSNSVLIQRKN